MSSLFFRLPPEVQCSLDGSTLCISGLNGLVFLKFSGSLIQRSRMLLFSRRLTPGELISLKQAVYGVSLSYRIVLVLQGIGYRVEKKNNELFLKLGYSHPVSISVPEVVNVSCKKNMVFLQSSHLYVLKAFAAELRRCRLPDSYKGSGILYQGEVVVKKEGKKT